MIVYKEEAYLIMGAAFKVYNNLRHGFLEAVYQEALEIEFQKQGIPYEREKELKIPPFLLLRRVPSLSNCSDKPLILI